MGKAKRERKAEMGDLKAWFNEFSLACPWRMQPKEGQAFCIATMNPKGAMVCMALNCAPLFMSNRLIQMTFGPRVYKNEMDTKPV
ncbi:MAG: hypothetical protein ABIL06_16220 [Pseudomonadota bacterium]